MPPVYYHEGKFPPGGNKGTLLNNWNNLDWRTLSSGNSTTFPNCSVEEEATSPTDPGKRYLFIEG